MFVVNTQYAPQLEILRQLFQFFSHGDPCPDPAAESSGAPRGAESFAPSGRDRRVHTGRLRAPRRGTARADIPAAAATVAAGQEPPPCGLFASAPPHRVC